MTVINYIDAEEILKVKRATLWRLIREGKLSRVKTGFVDKESLDRYLKNKNKSRDNRKKKILSMIVSGWKKVAPLKLADIAKKTKLSTSVIAELLKQLQKENDIIIENNLIFPFGLKQVIQKAVSDYYK